MSNALTNPAAAALGNIADLKRHLQTTKTAVKTSGVAGILKFTKHGEWVFGRDNREVTVDDLAAVNPMSFVTGYTCWSDDDSNWKGGPVDEIEVPLGQQTPPKHTLPQHDKANWQEMVGFSLRFTEGPLKGQQAKFTTTSVGGHTAVGALMDAVMARLDDNPDTPVPVVSLSGDHYPHKKYGKTFYPVIDIEDWMSMDGAAAPQDEGEPEREPEREQEREPEREPEGEPQPTRRRRRA